MNKIKELRKERKLSQKELGALIHVAPNTIAGYELGIREPNLDKVQKLAEVFGVTVDEIINTPPDPFTGESGMVLNKCVSLPISGIAETDIYELQTGEPPSLPVGFVDTRMLKNRQRRECELLKIMTDCMAPTFNYGDMIVIHRQSEAANGNIVVVRDENEGGLTMMKYLRTGDRVQLVPLNSVRVPKTYTIASDHGLNIYGICLSQTRDLV